MTKTKLYATISRELKELDLPEETLAGVQAIIDTYLKPKRNQGISLDEITERDEEGSIVRVQCQLSGRWLPATADYFPLSNKGRLIGMDGNLLKPYSLQAREIITNHRRQVKASIDGILTDIQNEDLPIEEVAALRERLIELKNSEPDFSVMDD